MILSRFLKSRKTRRQRTAFRDCHRLICKPQTLETKALLAGNVTTQLIGQTALVTGDSADNSVELVVEDGSLIARGLDGTTVNGQTADVVLGSADAIGRNLIVNMRSGDDLIRVSGVSVGRSVIMSGGSGNDTFAVADSTIGLSAIFYGQSGDDLVTTSGTSVGRNFVAYGGQGSDDIVVDQTDIGRTAIVHGQSGDDDVVFRDSEVAGDVRLFGQRGSDIFVFDSTTVGDRSWMFGGAGGDVVQLIGTSRFGDRISAFGGRQSDAFEVDSQVTTSGVRSRSFVTNTPDATLIEDRINSTTTGAIAAAEAALNITASTEDLTLTVDNSVITESDGTSAATVTVSRSGDTTEAVEVTLDSSDARLAVQSTTLTIAAGQSSATIDLDVVDDTIIGNQQTIQVTATATGFNGGSVDVVVNDDDQGTLTVTSNVSTVAEDTGSPTTNGVANSIDLTISHSGNITEEVVANLSASLADEFVLPATVTIPAGSTSTTITVDTVQDIIQEADQQVVITVASPGFNSGSVTVTVEDTDAEQLSIVFDQPTIDEVGSGTFSVSRNTADTTDALTVTVTSDDPASLLFDNSATSTSVVIPAGQTDVSVTVFGVPEGTVDGDLSVGITASATGFTDGNQTTIAEDDDSPTLTLQANGGNSVAEDGGATARQATVTRNTADTSTAVEVTLSVTGDARVSVPATVTIPAGSGSVDFNIEAIDNNLIDQSGSATITASSADFVPSSVTVVVTDDDVATISLTPGSLSVSETAGVGGASLTVTRTDTSTAETITFAYSDTTSLSGPASLNFDVGESSQTLTLDVIDNDSFDSNASVQITASAVGQPDVTASVAIINDDILTNSIDVSSNATVESVEALLTRESSFVVSGTTAPGVTVQLDTDGNGDFAEGSVIADANGDYTFTTTLTHTDANNGLNPIRTRAFVASENAEVITPATDVHLVIGTVIRFDINQDLDNSGSNDFYDVELLDADAPITVANFLQYVDEGAYENSIIHRSPFNFVIQGGGFTTDNGSVSPVVTRDPIQNEFNSENSNLRGTLSMAQLGGQPNSGTSQWFVNVSTQNTFLDDALHTVFGRVLGSGLNVVDDINQLPIHDVSDPLSSSALGELPLTSTPFSNIQGTIGLSANSTTVVGTGTAFTTELSVGDFIRVGAQNLLVTSIVSDTELTVDLEASSGNSGLTAERFDPPSDDEFVVFSNISEILDQV